MPQFGVKKFKKLASVSGPSECESGYPKIKIEEIYEPTNKLISILSTVKDHILYDGNFVIIIGRNNTQLRIAKNCSASI